MLTACGVTRHSVTIAPIGVVRVPESALPVKATRPPGDALRVDFTSSPDLLSEAGYVLDETGFCGDRAIRATAGVGPYLGKASIRHPVERQRVATQAVSSPAPPIYSVYLYVARPAYPAAHQIPAQPAYDLAREPRSICLSLSLREGYELARTTNTLSFSAEQVAAALSVR
jgi:hypothetical protein